MRTWVLAAFEEEEALLAAARRLREEGREGVDVHSPVPLHGTGEALGLPPSRVPLVCLVGGLVGIATGYLLQWWTVGVDFPINVGNRPPISAPAFIPITFELGVLFAAVSVFVSLLVRFGFPRPHHPVFEAEGFLDASVDGLWLSVPVPDGEPSPVDELRSLGARRVEVVEVAEEGASA
jgi:hypothetical protein